MQRPRYASAFVVGLALVMLAITILPAEIWRSPTNDAVFHGFDRNLISTSGAVAVTSGAIDATAPAASIASATLATTLRQKLTVSVEAKVLSGDALQPFRIGIWSPWTKSGYFIAFGPSPDNSVVLERITDGTPEATLIGETETSELIGHYSIGMPYRIAFAIDRVAKIVRATVSGDGLDQVGSLTAAEMPDLFGNVQLSVTASAFAGPGTAHFVLRDYTLTLPHERSWAAPIDDPRAKALSIALGLLGIVAIAIASILRLRRVKSIPRLSISRLASGAAAVYLVGNALLFPLGSHPFDFANEELFAYVAKTYGVAQLFFLPDVTSLASVWGGIPWIQDSFPYGPVVAYLSGAVGWLGALVLGGNLKIPSDVLGYVIKSANVTFGLIDGFLIYAILRTVNINEHWSKIGAALFLFNPAVWFSMSIWGQTHVFSIFFILLSVLFAQKRLPFWSWLALAAACLTRPQMVVFGLLLGVVLLRLFSWRENVVALSWSVVVTFIAILPLTLATSPSLPVDILLNNFHVQEAGGNQSTLTTVSQDAYSIWPLVTYFFRGAYSLHRAFTPSSEVLFGSITYQRASQVITVAAMVAVTAGLLLRKRPQLEDGGYLPLVTVGVMSFLMLSTGIVATHFLLALPLIILCRRWMDGIAYGYAVGPWSISTLVPMFGDLGVAISGHGYPLLAPEHNPVTHLVVNLYAWDRFITVAIVANVLAVVWLAWLSLTSGRRETPTVATAA